MLIQSFHVFIVNFLAHNKQGVLSSITIPKLFYFQPANHSRLRVCNLLPPLAKTSLSDSIGLVDVDFLTQ